MIRKGLLIDIHKLQSSSNSNEYCSLYGWEKGVVNKGDLTIKIKSKFSPTGMRLGHFCFPNVYMLTLIVE